MGNKEGNNSAEIKSGLFIIISLALLIFSIFWVRFFAIAPEKKVIAKFDDPGPVEAGISVYYKGVNVGKVPKIEFSDDFRNTYIYLDIYNKKLKLPSNIKAIVKTEGITGQKYINLLLPETPSDTLLASGDVIAGEKGIGLSELQDFLKKEIQSGRLEKMFNNIEKTLASANYTTEKIGKTSEKINYLMAKYDKNINNIIVNTSSATTELNDTAKNLNKIVKSEELQQGIKDTVANVNGFVKQADANSQKVFAQIDQTSVIPNMNKTLCKAYTTMEEAEYTMETASKAVCRFDCVGKNINEMLNQRFLLFKLMFGKAGKDFTDCENSG